MATAVIDIRVKGQDKVSKMRQQVAKINSLIRGIRPVPQLFDTRTFQQGKRVAAAAQKLKNELKGIADGTIKVQGTTASLNRQLGNLESIFGSLTAGTKEWRQALVATERAQESLFRSSQKAMVQRAKSLSSYGGGKDIVPSLIGFETETTGGKKPERLLAQSVNGLSAYRSELQRLRNEVKLGSKEYKDLGEAIERVNRTLAAKEGLAGLKQNLDQVSASQSKLLTSSSAYVRSTEQVRQAEQALNVELIQRRRVLDQVIIAEQKAMGGSGGIIERSGKGGIIGLKNALAEAEGIQSRMLTTEEGYAKQVQVVKEIQKAINNELAQRDLFMGKINIKEQKSASLAERLRGLGGAVGGAVLNNARPGRAMERRGLIAGGVGGLAGLGMASKTAIGGGLLGLGSKTLGFAGTAAGAGAGIGIPGMGLAAKGIADTKAAMAGLMAAAKALAGINVLNPGFIAALGVAWIALGTKGFVRAAKDLDKVGKAGVKTTATLFGLGKAAKFATVGMSHDFKLTSKAAEELKVDVEAVVLSMRKQKLAEARFAKGVSTGTVLGGGFGSWSSKMDKQYPTGDAKVLMERANRDRRDQMMITNAVEKANIRLVEVKGRQLDIDQRIERTLKNRGLQIQKNGKYLERSNRSGKGGMMSGFSGSRLGQAVLGGGFPLLFGGGPGTVGGGAIGGLLGGFAGGIGGSLIGGVADRAVASVAKLGQAFNKFSLDVTEITKSLGVAGTATAQYLQTLEAVKGPMAAATEAQKRLRSIIGEKGVADLKEFGERSQLILNSTQKFFTRMSAGLANILNWADKILGLSSGLDRRELRSFAMNEANTDPQLVKLRAELKDLGPDRLSRRDDKKFNDVYTRLENRAREIMTGQTQEDLAKNATLQLESDIKKLEEILELGTKEAGIQHEVASILKEKGIIRNEDNKVQIKAIEDSVRAKKQLEEQVQLWQQIKDTIATGLTNAITGLIEGTKTLKEALAGILKQIAQIILQKAIANAIGAGMGFASGGVAPGGTSAMVARDNAMYGNTFPAGSFSTGGMVTRPTVGLIGEAGEDEYIIPASKMAQSMQRYSAGARGEAVIPATGSSYAGGGAGGSTTVNYSGPILNFNSEEFVPKSAVGQIIATATSQGAKAGENRTLATLRNSRSTRSRLGM